VSSQLAAVIEDVPVMRRVASAPDPGEEVERTAILARVKAGVRRAGRALRRAVRLGVGLTGLALLVLVFLRWVVIPTAWPTTAEAWLQAPLVVVRADADGDLDLRCQDGDLVEPDAAVAAITNGNVDPARVAHLRSSLATVEADFAKHEKDLEAARAFNRLSGRELDAYRRALVAGLKLSLAEADAQVAECVIAHDQARRVADLHRRAGSAGAASDDERLRAVEGEQIARTRLDRAKAARDRLTVELEAVEKDVYVQRESPVYLAVHLQGRLGIPQIEANLGHAKDRRAAVRAELDQIEAYAKRQGGGVVRTPVGGVVWRRTPSRGTVAKGESLVEVAETRLAFVEAVFPEGHAPSLSPGSRAVVVFRGLPPFEGHVQTVRQPSPTDQDAAYAIQHPRRLNQLKAVIAFEGARPDAALLGRPCTVMIPDPTTPAHAWAERLFVALRW
jgi:multidrug resistance efflux pump